MKKWLDRAFFDPATKGQTSVYLFILILIVISILHLSIAVQYPEFRKNHDLLFQIPEWIITVLFSIEILFRIALRPHPRSYLFTSSALIDLLAVLPTWLGLFLPLQEVELTWLRSLRMVRLLRSIKLSHSANRLKNRSLKLLANIAPFMALAFAVKAVLLYLESLGLWPKIPGLGTVVSVVGFAIGVLLSTKLATVQNRMYTFEERIAQLVGSVEAARAHSPHPEILQDWLYQIYRMIRTGVGWEDFESANRKLIESHEGQVPGPIWLNLHQHARFLLHRMWTVTPEAYDQVLKNITIIYIATVILTIPGLTGLLASFLVIYVLGGLFIVIDSMDLPFDPSGDALINSDLSSLERYLSELGFEVWSQKQS